MLPAPVPPQACVLYVLRVGVIEQLGEGGQRALLDRLRDVLGAPLGQFTPVGVVALEAMALLLEVLGEVSAEKRAELEPALGAKVAGPHACLRLQAAAAVAALAVAEPSSAARLVGAILANLHAARQKLAEATAGGPPDRSRPGVPGTPRGVGSVKLKPDMNAVHGWALAGGALVAAAARLPLGVPSSLLAAVHDYAAGLIAAPLGAPQVGCRPRSGVPCTCSVPPGPGRSARRAQCKADAKPQRSATPGSPRVWRRAWWRRWSARRGTSCWARSAPACRPSCCWSAVVPAAAVPAAPTACWRCLSRRWVKRRPPSWTAATAPTWWVGWGVGAAG